MKIKNFNNIAFKTSTPDEIKDLYKFITNKLIYTNLFYFGDDTSFHRDFTNQYFGITNHVFNVISESDICNYNLITTIQQAEDILLEYQESYKDNSNKDKYPLKDDDYVKISTKEKLSKVYNKTVRCPSPRITKNEMLNVLHQLVPEHLIENINFFLVDHIFEYAIVPANTFTAMLLEGYLVEPSFIDKFENTILVIDTIGFDTGFPYSNVKLHYEFELNIQTYNPINYTFNKTYSNLDECNNTIELIVEFLRGIKVINGANIEASLINFDPKYFYSKVYKEVIITIEKIYSKNSERQQRRIRFDD